MYDTLYYGRSFRTLNVIDDSNREVLAIEINLSLPETRVVRVMEQLEKMVGLPKAILLHNWSELHSTVFTSWCTEKGIELKFIQPGIPQQNDFIERFNCLSPRSSPMPISLNHSNKWKKIPRNGSAAITKIVLMQDWGNCHRYTIDNEQSTLGVPTF